MSAFEDFSFGEGDSDFGKTERRFKMKKGDKAVISFAWFKQYDDEGNPIIDPDAGGPRFIGCKRLYREKIGYFIDKGPEYRKLSQSGESRRAVGCLIVVWPIDEDGNINVKALAKNKYKVLPWVFGNAKYEELKNYNNRYPFGKCDLEIVCTDEQYQKMNFMPIMDGMLPKAMKSGKLWPRLKVKIENGIDEVKDAIARDMTLSEIREALGEEGPGPVTTGVSEEIESEMADLLDE